MVSIHATRSCCALILRAWWLILVCGAIASHAIASDRQFTDNAWREASPATQSPPAPIIVVPGRGGVMIASEDVKALDEFERWLTIMAQNLASEDPGVTVFYLKHAKADAVVQTLEAVLAGAATRRGRGRRGAGGAGRDDGLGTGDWGLEGPQPPVPNPQSPIPSPGGPPRITAEPRLNALIVQCDPADADRIEELLKVLDRKQTPQDVRIPPRPRIVAVKNVPAQHIAEVVGQVYSDRMIGGSGRNTGPTPGMPQGTLQIPSGVSSEALERLARFGGTGGRGGGRAQAEEVPKMSIGVNTRTNSLVVVAPDAMFREVEDLVGQLDQAASHSKEVVEVLALRGRRDAGVLAQALPAILGEHVRVSQAALAASPSGLAGMQAQGRFGQRQPLDGFGPQTGAAAADPSLAQFPAGPAASQAMGAGLAGAGQGPFGAPGMDAGPAAMFQAGPQPTPFSPQFPGSSPGLMGEGGPTMGPGQPGSAPASPGGEGAGPGAPAGPGPGGP
jgi:hypothetical protein